MTQFRFHGSVTFRAKLDRSPSQFGVPELPGVGMTEGYQNPITTEPTKGLTK
jgi:hypothetical protein